MGAIRRSQSFGDKTKGEILKYTEKKRSSLCSFHYLCCFFFSRVVHKKKLCKPTAKLSGQKRIRACINALAANSICIINPFFARLRIIYSKIIQSFRKKKKPSFSHTQAQILAFLNASLARHFWVTYNKKKLSSRPGNWPFFVFLFLLILC